MSGYLPTRDGVIEIVSAAKDLYRLVKRWRASMNLPAFPADRGNHAALESLFEVERALNPLRSARPPRGRADLVVRNWPPAAADGLIWLRRLIDLILEKNELQSMCSSVSYEEWAAKRSIPPTVSVTDEEVAALCNAIRWILPALRSMPAADAIPRPAELKATIPVAAPLGDTSGGPVVLFGATNAPVVLGRTKGRLSPAQYRVVKGLIDAGEKGLKKSQLILLTGDAINVLKRLARADDDWRAVIVLAGKAGRRYRIAMPAGPTPAHTSSGSQTHTTPHRTTSA